MAKFSLGRLMCVGGWESSHQTLIECADAGMAVPGRPRKPARMRSQNRGGPDCAVLFAHDIARQPHVYSLAQVERWMRSRLAEANRIVPPQTGATHAMRTARRVLPG